MGDPSFDDKHKKNTPTDIIEDITAVAIDPNKILEEMITSAFDCHLPSHGGADDEYTRREGEWLEKFSGTYRGTGTQGRTFIRTSYQALQSRTEFWYYQTRCLDETKRDYELMCAFSSLLLRELSLFAG